MLTAAHGYAAELLHESWALVDVMRAHLELGRCCFELDMQLCLLGRFLCVTLRRRVSLMRPLLCLPLRHMSYELQNSSLCSKLHGSILAWNACTACNEPGTQQDSVADATLAVCAMLKEGSNASA